MSAREATNAPTVIPSSPHRYLHCRHSHQTVRRETGKPEKAGNGAFGAVCPRKKPIKESGTQRALHQHGCKRELDASEGCGREVEACLSSSMSTQASFQDSTKSRSIRIWTHRNKADPTRATQPATICHVKNALYKRLNLRRMLMVNVPNLTVFEGNRSNLFLECRSQRLALVRH